MQLLLESTILSWKQIEKGIDVNWKNEDDGGKSALMIASLNGKLEVVKLLLKNGAQVDLQDGGGWSALMCASVEGHAEVTKVLLEKGAQVDLKNNIGWSALMFASKHG